MAADGGAVLGWVVQTVGAVVQGARNLAEYLHEPSPV